MNVDYRLPRLIQLLDEFEENDINYCHWKSNEHVIPAVKGDTDLDILFSENQYEQVKHCLNNAGFIKFDTAGFLTYPFIEDYLTIDESSGKILHVHAHFRLIMGQKKIKAYRTPWEDKILNNKIWDDSAKIYTSRPVDELLLLIIRLVLKSDTFINTSFEENKEIIDARIEFTWLKERVTEKNLIEQFERIFDEKYTSTIAEFYRDGITSDSLQNLSDHISYELLKFKHLSDLRAKWERVIRKYHSKVASRNKRYNVLPIRNHRVLPEKGLIVAFLGVDGSGKSTQTELITRELRKKMDSAFIYMGSGKGAPSFQRVMVKKVSQSIIHFARVLKVANKQKKETGELKESKASVEQKRSKRVKIMKAIRGFSLASERKSKLKKARRLKDGGVIVVCDRYPQSQVPGFNDGLQLNEMKESSNPLLKYFANYERRCYELSDEIKPDLVIKLIGKPEKLHKRRSEEISLDHLKEKQNGIKELQFKKITKIVEIDATLSVEKILSVSMAEIGNIMRLNNL